MAPPSMIRLVISRPPRFANTLSRSGRPSIAGEPPGKGWCHLPRVGASGPAPPMTPRDSSSRRLFSSAKQQKTMRSSRAVLTTRESSGKRKRESRITRSSGLRRGSPSAISQQRIVRDYGAHADHDGVVGMTQLVHVRPGFFAGDPTAARRQRPWQLGSRFLPEGEQSFRRASSPSSG